MLRTIALFPKNWYIVIPLLLISGAQWAILFHVRPTFLSDVSFTECLPKQGISTVRATYDPVAKGCVVEQVLPIWLDMVYLYSTFCVLSSTQGDVT
jgi:hypothetical protein